MCFLNGKIEGFNGTPNVSAGKKPWAQVLGLDFF